MLRPRQSGVILLSIHYGLGTLLNCTSETDLLCPFVDIVIISLQKVEELTPLTREVISRQATINIGTIGHVAHGKSTVVKAISGVQVRTD